MTATAAPGSGRQSRGRDGFRYWLATDTWRGGERSSRYAPPSGSGGHETGRLLSPYSGHRWPSGWAIASCDRPTPCEEVPGPRCACGFTLYERLDQIVGWQLSVLEVVERGEPHRIHPQNGLIAIGRVKTRGTWLDTNAALHSGRVGQAKLVELWLPANRATWVDEFKRTYPGLRCHVGRREGAAWLAEVDPTAGPLPPEVPAPVPLPLRPVLPRAGLRSRPSLRSQASLVGMGGGLAAFGRTGL